MLENSIFWKMTSDIHLLKWRHGPRCGWPPQRGRCRLSRLPGEAWLLYMFVCAELCRVVCFFGDKSDVMRWIWDIFYSREIHAWHSSYICSLFPTKPELYLTSCISREVFHVTMMLFCGADTFFFFFWFVFFGLCFFFFWWFHFPISTDPVIFSA